MKSIRITCQAIFALTCIVACFMVSSAETPIELPAIHNLDRDFLIQAVQMNMYELAAAKLAQKTTKRLDLKKLAEKTLIDRKLDNNDIQSSAQKRNVVLPLEPNIQQQRNLYVLNSLQGDAFDKFFLTVGAKYKFDNVEQYKRTAERSLDMIVKNYARKTLLELTQHWNMFNTITLEVVPEAVKPSAATGPSKRVSEQESKNQKQ